MDLFPPMLYAGSPWTTTIHLMMNRSYNSLGKSDLSYDPFSTFKTVAPPVESHDHNLGALQLANIYNSCSILQSRDHDVSFPASFWQVKSINDVICLMPTKIHLTTMVKMVTKLDLVTSICLTLFSNQNSGPSWGCKSRMTCILYCSHVC